MDNFEALYNNHRKNPISPSPLPEDVYTISGNTDLLIANTCTLNCKNCGFLDFDFMGSENHEKTIPSMMTLQDVKKIVENLIDIKVGFAELTLLGGEPTINPQFVEIVDYLSKFKGQLYTILRVITNGTNLKPHIVESFRKLDYVVLSLYPDTKSIIDKMKKSGLYEYFDNNLTFNIWYSKEFFVYGTGGESDRLGNWEKCWAKKRCRNLDSSGLYMCYILYGKKMNVCNLTNQQEVVDYFKTESFSLCEFCTQPPPTEPWENNGN